jgi:hypothetical protein
MFQVTGPVDLLKRAILRVLVLETLKIRLTIMVLKRLIPMLQNPAPQQLKLLRLLLNKAAVPRHKVLAKMLIRA